MIIVTASTFFTVYVLNLHYRTPETHEMGTMVCVLLHSNKVKSLNNQIMVDLDKNDFALLASIFSANGKTWSLFNMVLLASINTMQTSKIPWYNNKKTDIHTRAFI